MTEPLTFLAQVAPTDCALQFGHDGARVEIWSKDIITDFAEACKLVGYTGKVLALSFFEPTGQDAMLTFTASIAGINSAIRMSANRVKVKFDVPQTHKTAAARLAGMTERVYRLEVAIEGETQKREPKPPKEPTPYGKFWQTMDKAGFHNRHDVRTWINAHDLMEAATKERMRKAWRVTSRANEMSPDDVVAWLMDQPESHGAITMVRKIAAGHWQHNI